MSYQVLARQWRPRTFADVVGQQHVLSALSNALRHQRLHHAYLLSGTRGVGKTTIARILSRSLNCLEGISAEPCGVCDACKQIDEGRFVDLLEIDAASRTKVEDTREILENVQYRPTSGRYKVYLIDEVHMLSRHSFNALLKTLEEPPPHAIFLLATTDPDKLPVTVLSRCLQFNLRALTREEISGQLHKVLSAEEMPFDQGALDLIARAARGSMRDALSLTDQAIAQGNNEVREETVARMLGSLDPRDNIALLGFLAQGNTQQTLNHLRALPDRMTDISDVLGELQNMLHQLALLQLAPEYLDSGLVSHREAMKQLAEQLRPEQIQVWYRMVLEGRKELPLATDAFTAVEMTLLRLLTFRPAGSGAGTPSVAPANSGQEPIVSGAPEQPIAAASSAEHLSTAQPSSNQPSPSHPSEALPSMEQLGSRQISTAQLNTEQLGSGQPSLGQPRAEQPSVEQPDSHQDNAFQHSQSLQGRGEGSAAENAAQVLSVAQEESEAQLHAEQAHIQQQAEQMRQASVVNEDPLQALLATRDMLTEPREPASGPVNAVQNLKAVQHRHSAPAGTENLGTAQMHEPSNVEYRYPKAEPTPEPVTQVSGRGPERGEEAETPVKEAQQNPIESAPTRAAANENFAAKINDSVRSAADIDAWSASIEGLGVQGLARQLLLHSQLKQQGGGYTLVISEQQQALFSPQSEQHLRAELQHLVGNSPLSIEFGRPQQTPFLIQQRIDQYRQQRAEERVQSHSAIQYLQDTLALDWVQGSIQPRD
ncbi:DNA polymerase III subunit gamma/tau [Aliidiomarina celeris]|uniref:DNA polymerase III subunit gamma/tau n=1 Tax=Aliidiomarina celeris TaxID=2249428 RepID=UPI000DE96B04|nr:DNA polymerase III subunit gamma/tau [Aliidiomarina celeris]